MEASNADLENEELAIYLALDDLNSTPDGISEEDWQITSRILREELHLQLGELDERRTGATRQVQKLDEALMSSPIRVPMEPRTIEPDIKSEVPSASSTVAERAALLDENVNPRHEVFVDVSPLTSASTTTSQHLSRDDMLFSVGSPVPDARGLPPMQAIDKGLPSKLNGLSAPSNADERALTDGILAPSVLITQQTQLSSLEEEKSAGAAITTPPIDLTQSEPVHSSTQRIATEVQDNTVSPRVKRPKPSANRDSLQPAATARPEAIVNHTGRLYTWDDDLSMYLEPAVDETATPGPSSSASHPSSWPPRIECKICTTTHPPFDISFTPCTPHPCPFCRTCLAQWFHLALTDRSAFPPTCCNATELPVSMARDFLPPGFIARYQARKFELSVPNPTYCAACARFVPPARIVAAVAACEACETRSCATCKQRAHAGVLCPEDEGTKDLEWAARWRGWRKCYRCGELVEHGSGCYHMTCHCRAEFCYLCGKQWKTCSCVYADEGSLYDRPLDLIPPRLGSKRQFEVIEGLETDGQRPDTPADEVLFD